MSTTTDELPKGGAAAVHEAARITREAANRGNETAKASIEVARSYVDEANALGRDLYATWSAEGEAMLKGAFEAQDSVLDVYLALFDLGVKSNRQIIEQYFKLVHQTEAATLDNWKAAARAVSKAFQPPL